MSHEHRVSLSELGNVQSARTRDEDVCLHTYTLDTVKRTCYRYSDRYFLKVATDTDHATVTFRFPSTVSKVQEEEIIERFHQDLLDQDLRATVAQETEVLRNLILANAFSQTELVETDDD